MTRKFLKIDKGFYADGEFFKIKDMVHVLGLSKVERNLMEIDGKIRVIINDNELYIKSNNDERLYLFNLSTLFSISHIKEEEK